MSRSPVRAWLRVPKPRHLLSRLLPGPGADAALRPLLVELAERYRLGELREWRRARRSSSLNVFVTTARGRYVFRRHLLSEEMIARGQEAPGHPWERSLLRDLAGLERFCEMCRWAAPRPRQLASGLSSGGLA